jgi:hypothetical protein
VFVVDGAAALAGRFPIAFRSAIRPSPQIPRPGSRQTYDQTRSTSPRIRTSQSPPIQASALAHFLEPFDIRWRHESQSAGHGRDHRAGADRARALDGAHCLRCLKRRGKHFVRHWCGRREERAHRLQRRPGRRPPPGTLLPCAGWSPRSTPSALPRSFHCSPLSP